MPDAVRILLLADSHIGFDLPAQPRVERRRRGHDFLANYAAALEPARSGCVDAVVHAGDVFDRPKVSREVAFQAFEPLRRIADQGIPVFVVPGNHERSALPHVHLASHPNVRVFDRPRTFELTIRGVRLALSGFPYERREARRRFTGLLDEAGYGRAGADVRMLCMHHCAEGATVGPGEFTFTTAPDVVRLRDIPANCAAVLSGHIHRRQALTTDLRGDPVGTPVLYPGSIERTSFAEIGETKGFMLVSVDGNGRVRWEFHDLPARPMIRRELAVEGLAPDALHAAVHAIVQSVPEDAVLSIRLTGEMNAERWRALSAPRLRAFVPQTMNVNISGVGRIRRPRVDRRTTHNEPVGLFADT